MILRNFFQNCLVLSCLFLILGFASWMIIPPAGSMAASGGANFRQLRDNLQNSLRRFNLLKLNTNETLAQVKADGKLILPTTEKNLEITLQPRDLRAANYRAEATGTDGRSRELPKDSAVHTFKGKVAGAKESQVRLALTENKIEGYISFDGKQLFIEPAKDFSSFAEADDFVIYEAADLIKSLDFDCETALPDKINQTAQTYFLPDDLTAQPLQVHTIATEADFEYVTLLGGAPQANAEILSILNMVEGVYENELNLRLSVSFQHTWIAPDPFQGNSTIENFLYSFRDYWNVNFPVSQIPRNAANLWTNKAAFAGVNARGIAYVGVVCQNQAASYSLAGRRNEDYAFAINYLVAAHEIAHTFNASHVATAESCNDTIMNPTVSNLTPLTFCPTSRTQIRTYISQNSSCLPQAVTKHTASDFDGDNKTDIAVYRPSTGIWYRLSSSNNSVSVNGFGIAEDKIVPADYDGDNKTDLAVYRPSTGVWYVLNSSNNAVSINTFGITADKPVPADYDGDGKTDLAVYRPATGVWYVLKSSGGVSINGFGTSEDMPIPADFDGDGKADIAVYRPSNGFWYRLNSSNGAVGLTQFGLPQDKPLPADFDGDGKADIAVFRPSNGYWYRLNSSNGSFNFVGFGLATDMPNLGDFDDDDKADIAVYRPSNGVWYRLNSSNNAVSIVQFGIGEDLPTSSAFVR